MSEKPRGGRFDPLPPWAQAVKAVFDKPKITTEIVMKIDQLCSAVSMLRN